MEASLRWDTDNDGIIDNAGFADQTYDAWTVTGARCVAIDINLCGIYVFMFCHGVCQLLRKCGRNSFDVISMNSVYKGWYRA